MIDLKLKEDLDLDFENDLVATNAIGHSLNYAIASKIGESTLRPEFGLRSFGRIQQNDINEIDSDVSQVLNLFVQDGLIESFSINSQIVRSEYIAEIEISQTKEQAALSPIVENQEEEIPIRNSLTPEEIIVTYKTLKLINGNALRLIDGRALRLRE